MKDCTRLLDFNEIHKLKSAVFQLKDPTLFDTTDFGASLAILPPNCLITGVRAVNLRSGNIKVEVKIGALELMSSRDIASAGLHLSLNVVATAGGRIEATLTSVPSAIDLILIVEYTAMDNYSDGTTQITETQLKGV